MRDVIDRTGGGMDFTKLADFPPSDPSHDRSESPEERLCVSPRLQVVDTPHRRWRFAPGEGQWAPDRHAGGGRRQTEVPTAEYQESGGIFPDRSACVGRLFVPYLFIVFGLINENHITCSLYEGSL